MTKIGSIPVQFKWLLANLGHGALNSYGQIFFAQYRALSIVLLLVAFFDLGSGFGGLMAVILAQMFALALGQSAYSLRDGSLTYNALMTGMALGMAYEWNLALGLLIALGSLLSLLFTMWFSAQLGARRLPFLSLPFLLAIWVVLLGAQSLSVVELSPKSYLSLYTQFPEIFNQTNDFISQWPAANYFHLLFRSVGAIFFQFNDLAGILILLAVLFQSRIAFVLSIYSFSLGYGFYSSLEGDFSQLIYAYIGFNFILTGIALGGFFIVADWRNFVLLAVAVPLSALLIAALDPVFQSAGLPLYSLPFNLVVLLVLSALWQRFYPKTLLPVYTQTYSLEENLYAHQTFRNRFAHLPAVYVHPPILGEWYVSQAFDGTITHLDAYKFAWDFDQRDTEGFSFKEPGEQLEDFYAWNLPVVAPAAGYVVALVNDLPDNAIGNVDLKNNWGNTLVIKHVDGLFSKLCHLKAGSILPKLGEYVLQGQVVARCGNSGRSPEPHLHFQIQATEHIGAPTIKYPLCAFVVGGKQLKQFDYPKEGERVSPFVADALLKEVFGLYPGCGFKVQATGFRKSPTELEWKVYTNAANRLYLYCKSFKQQAYFTTYGHGLRFDAFEGNAQGPLYFFYLATYHVFWGRLSGSGVSDLLPVRHFSLPHQRFVADLLAPFVGLLKVKYSSKMLGEIGNSLTYETEITRRFLGKEQIWATMRVEINQEKQIGIEIIRERKPLIKMVCHPSL